MRDLTKNETPTRHLSIEGHKRLRDWPHGLEYKRLDGTWEPRRYGVGHPLAAYTIYRAIPAPETDLTKNTTVTRDLSAKDQKRLRDWPHGLELRELDGTWLPRNCGVGESLAPAVTYRAIPAPVTAADEDPAELAAKRDTMLEAELSRQTRRADAYRAALRGIALTADRDSVRHRAEVGIREGDAE